MNKRIKKKREKFNNMCKEEYSLSSSYRSLKNTKRKDHVFMIEAMHRYNREQLYPDDDYIYYQAFDD